MDESACGYALLIIFRPLLDPLPTDSTKLWMAAPAEFETQVTARNSAYADVEQIGQQRQQCG